MECISTNARTIKRKFLHTFFLFFFLSWNRGNCNVFDLKNMQTWVWQQKLPLCSVLQFVPKSTLKVIAGTKTGSLMMLDMGMNLF